MNPTKLLIVLVFFGIGASGCDDKMYTMNPGSTCPLPGRFQADALTSFPIHVSSHIPRAVKQFKDHGKCKADKTLSVTVALGLSNEDALDQKLAELYLSGSRQFLSPEEFRAQFAPTQAQVIEALDFLNAQGLKEVELNNNGYLVRASGTVQALNQAFNTDIHEYEDDAGKGYFAPANEPQMPPGLVIKSVIGLHNVTRLRTHLLKPHFKAQAVTANASSPVGLTPVQIRKAYNIPTSMNGAGQTLALVELDGYTASDVSKYEQAFGLPAVPLQNILVDGFLGTAGDGAGEVTLDIELMIALAPGAAKILVYEAPNTESGLIDLIGKIANDNTAKQVSTSWGAPEADQDSAFLQAENSVYKQMAAQGQSFFAASGDSGAYDNGNTIGVDDPASQPYVVGVGGTHLNSNSGNYVSETTWNGGTPSGGAGGGGVSTIWSQPKFQGGINQVNNGTSTTMRNVPDVALNADPSTGYAIYFEGSWQVFGGTSCAAPLWAAFTALINQQRHAANLSPLGFPGPALYAIGKSDRYSSDFRDIADGSTNLFYPATKGYDAATGLGTMSGTNLFDDLIKTDAGTSLPPVIVSLPISSCS